MKTIHKKILLLLLGYTINLSGAIACGPDYDVDYEYYNLFLQEIVEDDQYKPFFLTYTSNFYWTDKDLIRNENIEEWQEYFGISYENTYYLVFEADEEEIKRLLKGEKSNDPKLQFITPGFRKKYRQALEYIVYAKEIEPYMCIVPGEDPYWFWVPEYSAGDLDYRETTTRMKAGWKQAKDKELKLRYGYQLVRFAHYNRRYREAIELFDTYVEPLNFKPAMYYHALSQKAGAERGNGDISMANYHFLQVFVNSKNLKETAVLSIQFNDNPDWEELVSHAKDRNELNDAYLLLGYNSFNNPLNEIKKIVENDPDAIQAKVLMVRAINQIEREDMAIYPTYYWTQYRRERKGDQPDKRYPQAVSVTNDILTLSDGMAKDPAVTDKNFWFMTSAYLHFLHKDFESARYYLNQVEEENEKYALMKTNFSFYIDISEPTLITSEVEIKLYEKYKEFLTQNHSVQREDIYSPNPANDFVKDVLANRYFIQQDYAKSFLLTNPIYRLEENPQPDILKMLEEFHNKPDKNAMENFIADSFLDVESESYSDWRNYLDYVRGIVCLTQGDLSGAHTAFQNTDPQKTRLTIPDYVFGVNIVECINCLPDTIMIRHYLSDFPFIPKEMKFEELTSILLQLEKIGESDVTLSAKANYLLGNFFYNTSRGGYYRNILRFNGDNFYCYKYEFQVKPDIYDDIYFKYYRTYYQNTYLQSQKYLDRAYKQARGNELKAQITFALAKCEQEEFYNQDHYESNHYIKIYQKWYFKELLKYRNTSYFKEVESGCKYFKYYATKSLLP